MTRAGTLLGRARGHVAGRVTSRAGVATGVAPRRGTVRFSALALRDPLRELGGPARASEHSVGTGPVPSSGRS